MSRPRGLPPRPAAGARGDAGFTFVELIIAVIVMVLATGVLITHLAVNYSQLREQKDRVFAYMAAKSILSEVQAYAAADGTTDVDALDDGASTNPTLSIALDGAQFVAPDHELSGNSMRAGEWIWSRQISVRPFPGLNNRKLRYVSVRIQKRDKNNVQREIANLSSVINSLEASYPASQVFDVYFLAIENIPGWWVHMESIRPFMEAMVSDLERSNPGLSLRTHWITKASYGRNPVYRPFINVTTDSNTKPKGVYYYPGKMPAGSASTYYYVPGAIRARMQTALGELNGYDPALNPYPYSLADYYNHGMRLPRERALHDQRVAAVRQRKLLQRAAAAAGAPIPPPLVDMSEEPTYRLLLEDMCTDPAKYKNALLLNLHGELVPMPSIRNYSDAARSPVDLPGVRVVTHPEELRTKRDPVGGAHDKAVFRVYAYTTDPDSYTGPRTLGVANPVMLQVMGVDLTDGSGQLAPLARLTNLRGGVPVGGTTEYFDFAAAKPAGDATLVPDEMFYQAKFVDPGPGKEKYTLIALLNTPVVAPEYLNATLGDYQGIRKSTAARLYGMEYVPSCTEPTLDFSNNLADGGSGPKNTARWRLEIDGAALSSAIWKRPNGSTYQPAGDVQLTVRTRIYSTATGPWDGTGTMFPTPNTPENLSETYTWWAATREAVPFTERSQFLGDPRHNPYKDLYNGDPDFPNGYNWHFDSLQNVVDVTAAFPGLDKTRLLNGWHGRLQQDVGRYFELLRTALVRSGAVYNTLTGWSYYYMGHGNEIGYDVNNGYPNSIPTNLNPWGTNGTGFVNNITGTRMFVRQGGASYWWGMPWLGELSPDSHYTTQWMAADGSGKVSGNLAPGALNGNQFYRAPTTTVYTGSRNLTDGTAMAPSGQRLQAEGCTMFMNIGTSASTFNHTSVSAATGDLVGAGLELASNYNFDLPATTAINRPFRLNTARTVDSWGLDPYLSDRHTGALIDTYYDSTSSGYTGSGLIELTAPGGAGSAYIVVNGLAQSSTLGTSAIARYSLLTLVHSFFESGDLTLSNRILMPPRVELVYPTEIAELTAPASIDLRFDITWTRWDGVAYTGSTPSTFSENDGDIEYFLLYSKDSGATWLSVLDDAPVMPAAYPSDPNKLLSDFTTGAETHTWATPAAKFPSGSYVVRVEAYRKGQSLHYSYHQRRIFIDR